MNNSVLEKEYLLMSLLAYRNFQKKDQGKIVYSAFINGKSPENFSTNFKCLSEKSEKVFIDFFKIELKKWKILKVYDRELALKNFGRKDSGFFAISFTDGINVVIAFRGSELFPIEEALKDFIRNDVPITLGKRPIQFDTAENFYLEHINEIKIPKSKISLTGHSLGGGLAEYIAYFALKKYKYTPFTCTWNGVGIKRKGLIEMSTEELEKISQNKIINYGHSKDFTTTLYPHLGLNYVFSDINSEDKLTLKKNISEKIQKIVFKDKAIFDYHFDDVFIPHFHKDEKKYGRIETSLNNDFIASVIRKYIHNEEKFSDEILGIFYSKKKISTKKIIEIKEKIINSISESNMNIIYKNKIIATLKNSDDSEWVELWKKAKKKISSPYIYDDIFDSIIY